MSQLTGYLVEVGQNLRMDQDSEKEVMGEVYAHLKDEIGELRQAGYSQEEATRIAIERLGPAKSLARDIHEARSGEGWVWALLAAAPHFLVALTFTFHLWYNPIWLASLLIPFVAAIGYGWRRNKPIWLYPWMGYSVLGCVLILLLIGQTISFSSPWYWLLLSLLLPFVLWFAGFIIIYTLRRDWLLASLMILPLPVALAWFVNVEMGGVGEYQDFQSVDPRIAASFLILGLVVTAFVRLRKRLVKGGLLLLSTFVILIAMLYTQGVGLMTLAFLLSGLLLFPILLEPKVRRKKGSELESFLKERVEAQGNLRK